MSVAASREMGRLHDLMCAEALEGGLNAAQQSEFSQLALHMPEVNTRYYWEALGAADLALYGAALNPPEELQQQWLQDARAHFAWPDKTQGSDGAPVSAAAVFSDDVSNEENDESSVLDETIAIDSEAKGAWSGSVSGLDQQVELASGMPGFDRLDETVMDWDVSAAGIEQYVSEQRLDEKTEQPQEQPPERASRLGWWLAATVALLLVAGLTFKPQIQEALTDWGAWPQQGVRGHKTAVVLEAGGASLGDFTWDSASQQGRLNINTQSVSVDAQQQLQVWLMDSGRAGAAIPVALLPKNQIKHRLSVQSSLRIKNFGGLLISAEPLGGVLEPSEGSAIARLPAKEN